MNYIKQLNAFYDWLLLNPLKPKEQALYLAILHMNNKAGWKREFSVANQTLMALCQMSKSELHKVRELLEQKGLIEYKRGKKGEAGKYKIGFLYETNPETHLETNLETNLETHLEDINKHKHKQKQNNNNGQNEYTSEFEEFWKHYPRKVGKREAFAKWKTRLKQGETPERLLQACINYAKECRRLGTEKQFIKHPKTFLSDKRPYEDYIDYPEDKPNGQVREPSLFDMEVALNKHIEAGGSPDDFDIERWYRQRGVGS